jgi:hypothetical protein
MHSASQSRRAEQGFVSEVHDAKAQYNIADLS